MSDTLPIILPTVPGRVEGIVSLDPPMVQCQGCGATYAGRTLGLTVLRSNILFHQHRSPRLCKACRLALNCDCGSCRYDRTGSDYAARA